MAAAGKAVEPPSSPRQRGGETGSFVAPTTLRFYTSLSSRCCVRKYASPLRRG